MNMNNSQKKIFKVLYLDVNRLYHNPNNANFLKVLDESSELIKFGPGYSNQEILDEGIESFINKNNGFDFIVTEHLCIFWDEEDPIKHFRDSIIDADINSCQNFLKETKNYFINENSSQAKKLFFCNFDPYAISNSQIDLLEKSNAYLITKDHKFWLPTSSLKQLKNEKFYKGVNDNWFKYITKPATKKKIISYHTALDEGEFYSERLLNRDKDISIPGVEYHSRKIALKKLEQSNYNFKVGKDSSGIRRKLTSKAMQITKSKRLLRYYQDSYSKSIKNSKVCFTCGSALMYTIRKFYEIPAKGCVLLCEPLEPLIYLGFEDGKNCIYTDLDNIEEVLKNIIAGDMEVYQDIADNGRELMLLKHTIKTRSEQLYQVMKSISNNTFNGSEMIGGNQEIHFKIQ